MSKFSVPLVYELVSTSSLQSYKSHIKIYKNRKSQILTFLGQSIVSNYVQQISWHFLGRGVTVDLPPGCKPLGYKWIFKRKMKTDGSIDKYKARLVIKGYRQQEGLDYFDTYSPVTRINSIRMILAIAALRNLEVHQMDVKTAFLNGDIDETIYMVQPENFVLGDPKNMVCRLRKSIYG